MDDSGRAGGRSRILEAVVDVIADEGIDKASVRAVAQRAGVSIGAVQHHFRTKAQMLEGAMSQLTALFEAQARGDAATRADVAGMKTDTEREKVGSEHQESPGDPLLVLHTMCTGLALVDEDARRLGGVWLDFVATSRVNEGLAGIHRSAWARLRGLFAYLLAEIEPGHASPAGAADLLLASLDGIAVSRMTEPQYMTAERAREIVEAALSAARALGGVGPTGAPGVRAAGESQA